MWSWQLEESRSEDEAVDQIPKFEETYPRYEFAELVRLAMAAGAWLARVRDRVATHRPDVSGGLAPGEIKPAE